MLKVRFPLKITLLALFVLRAICAEDAWNGKEYAKNSESQKDSAQDLLAKYQYQLKGTEYILDAGCGDGNITAVIAQKVPQGMVLGIDISPSMIQFAGKTFSNIPNLSFMVQDVAEINFQNKFDLITSFTVMQWVLKQKEALVGFERALKPNGKLWIQMPTGLPFAMQRAVDELIQKEEWKRYFAGFSPPWNFFQLGEYRQLLIEAQLIPVRLAVESKNEIFPSREIFQGFLKQWFPYLRPLASGLKERFLTTLVDRYLQLCPTDAQGRVRFVFERLEVEAEKR